MCALNYHTAPMHHVYDDTDLERAGDQQYPSTLVPFLQHHDLMREIGQIIIVLDLSNNTNHHHPPHIHTSSSTFISPGKNDPTDYQETNQKRVVEPYTEIGGTRAGSSSLQGTPVKRRSLPARPVFASNHSEC